MSLILESIGVGLLIIFILTGCATTSENAEQSDFIGATCPHCEYKANSYYCSSNERINCPSCDKEFLIQHARQIYAEKQFNKAIAILGILPETRHPDFQLPKKTKGRIKPNILGGYDYEETIQ